MEEWISLSILIIWVDSLRYGLERDTKDPLKLSTNCEFFSVGSPLPKTIDLPDRFWACLWMFGSM